MDTLIQLQDISKWYGKEMILSDVSLTLNQKEAIAIIGDSGGGKTTLLSIMGLLQNASAGKVLVEGREINQLSENEKAFLRSQMFGFVFQRARLVNYLTAWENVLLPSLIIRKDKKLAQKGRELLVDFGMGKRLHHKPEQLSLGQLRRVALARALLLEPKIVLADEPTNDLDPKLAGHVAERLIQARNDGAGVIIVTHDLSFAIKADKIYRLKDSHLEGPVAADPVIA